MIRRLLPAFFGRWLTVSDCGVVQKFPMCALLIGMIHCRISLSGTSHLKGSVLTKADELPQITTLIVIREGKATNRFLKVKYLICRAFPEFVSKQPTTSSIEVFDPSGKSQIQSASIQR
ncbi:hypothetical protein Hypma_009333 [Hypsizygus marmoreus]|uniref:Uncharacterized protein n=1 Tax=Hypsizygus marmoreus TaxID=39966 RepID=A0A369JN99_HYPMA|nr:hypothetical protein Hypma_009333 [Hypsizygus marmoreus]